MKGKVAAGSVALLLLVGCRAHMVALPAGATGNYYEPSNEPGHGGIIKYRTGDVPSVVLARRQDAYWQMFGACSGPYQIDSEGPVAEGGHVYSRHRGYAYKTREYWYIQFSCVPAPARDEEGAPVAEAPLPGEGRAVPEWGPVPTAPPFAQPPPPEAPPRRFAQPPPPEAPRAPVAPPAIAAPPSVAAPPPPAVAPAPAVPPAAEPAPAEPQGPVYGPEFNSDDWSP
jgi:hypothetical protein